MSKGPKTGVVLVNLGTPDAPTTAAVRRYLREFLSDARVVDINPASRWLLVNLVIAPFRSPRSAQAYQKIWLDEGSPLLVHSRALSEAVARELADEYPVELAMRYGTPSISAAFAKLRVLGCERFIVLPLYPQYAASSTGSTEDAVRREAGGAELRVVPPFFDDVGFIAAWAAVARPELDAFEPDHVVFSFHGLPERHIRKEDESGRHCLVREDCCASVGTHNRKCYRAHCFATARALSEELGLDADRTTVAFQSRLGRTPWIQPFTDVLLRELATRGAVRVAVLSPAFVADCLETLEEIGIRAQADFLAAGGEALQLVPSLNANPLWVETVVRLIRETAAAPAESGEIAS